jgi:hypothetical protein
LGSINFHFTTFFFITPLYNEQRIVLNPIIYQTFLSDLGSLSETSMKVEKKSELIGRGGFYRRPVGAADEAVLNTV